MTLDLASALFIGLCGGVFQAFLTVEDTEDRRIRRVLPDSLDPWLEGWRSVLLVAGGVTLVAWGCQILAML